MNVDDLDPECALPKLLTNGPEKADKVDTILINSFGMVGINCVLIVSRYLP
jgi:3-oxoacyl-[acyl-carrier-protein] synthase II